MISFEEAYQLVLDQVPDYGTEYVPILESIGRVLREEVVADRDFPPFDRVTMDGIAIAYAAFKQGQRAFKIEGVAPAGAPQSRLGATDACIEVMTGASMPLNTDTVIRYEDLIIKDGEAFIQPDAVQPQQNVHFKGSDKPKGAILLSPGIRLSAAELGVMATVGKTEVLVSKLPRVAVLSSGDELVEVRETPLPYQIRKSNIYSLYGLLAAWNIVPSLVHLNDTYEAIVPALKEVLMNHDIVLLSGAVSKGKFDFLPKALQELGVRAHFHKVRQRPGKPFWFGTTPSNVVFAFPGNPVSTFMCATVYLNSFLSKAFGLVPDAPRYAILQEDVTFNPSLTYFLEVKLHYSERGELRAFPVKGNGSGDLANLVQADAFILLGESQCNFKKGSVHPIYPYR